MTKRDFCLASQYSRAEQIKRASASLFVSNMEGDQLFDLTKPYVWTPSLPTPIETSFSATKTEYQFFDDSGTFLGRVVERVQGTKTDYTYYNEDNAEIGSVHHKLTAQTETTIVYDEMGEQASKVRIISKPGYTTEVHWTGTEITSAKKEIHNDTTTGVKHYGSDWTLQSAYLEHDYGNGRTRIEEYGPGGELVYRETTTVKADSTKVVIHDAQGNIIGGSKTLVKENYTVHTTMGAGWVVEGYVKEMHSDTVTGEKVYDGNDTLLSASLVTTKNGRTITDEYGLNQTLISRHRVVEKEDHVFTEYLEGENAVKMWRTTVYNDGSDTANTYHVLNGEGFFEGTDARDRMFGNDGSDVFYGYAGRDLLNGGQGDDHLFGGDDSDQINGDGGDDKIYGGEGHDTINGGGGNDTIFGGVSKDVIDGGSGDDEISGGHGDDNVKGGYGRDLIFGDKGNDNLSGGADDDIIFGGQGDDTLFGNSGDDFLFGEEGIDRLFGSSGEDILQGNGDGDLLNGGSGADVFVFNLNDPSGGGARDTVADFEQGEDLLLLVFERELTLAMEPSQGQTDTVTVSEISGDSIVQIDHTGDGEFEYSIAVRGVTGLTENDFDFTTDFPLV